MYGIAFNGHPDLRRILMYPEFVGHPLRKDYPKEKRQPLVRGRTFPTHPRSRPGAGRRERAHEPDARRPRTWTRHLRLSRARPQAEDPIALEPELPTEPMTLNMGPSHPAMHGTVRMVLELDGETIVERRLQIGYLHRCFEKESASTRPGRRCFPYTDRLNYVSPMLNNVGYAMAVEKLHRHRRSPSAPSTSA